jgi:hypothetical protein
MSSLGEEPKKEPTIKGVSKTEYHRNYMRNWAKKARILDVRPKDVTRLHLYYDEYIGKCQRNFTPTVPFNEFLVQFCEVGFTTWRDANK